MAGVVITITSGKGGVGKTTSTANIGLALARRGKRVACVDMDIGLRNLDVVLGLENRIVFDIVDVIYGKARLKQALIKHKHVPSLQLLPAAQKYEKTVINEKQITNLCKDLRKEFDIVLLDCPAGIEHGYRNAVAPADQVAQLFQRARLEPDLGRLAFLPRCSRACIRRRSGRLGCSDIIFFRRWRLWVEVEPN